MIKERFFCGLDIGSQTVKAALVKLGKTRKPELCDVNSSKTHGFKDSSVTDLAEFSECIHSTIKVLSKKCGVKIKMIHLGFPGDLVDIREADTVIPLVDKGNKVISKRDINNVNSQARLLGIKMEEDILHDLPQHYIVDDMNHSQNPLGLYGRKLEVKSLMIISDINRIRNISKAVNQAGYDVGNIFFDSYSASDVALTDAQKMNGCVLVDIGSMVTSVLVFKDKKLRFVDKIKIGGREFTDAISEHLRIPFGLAEDIKKSYAVAINSDLLNHEEILIKREETYIPIKKVVIYKAIECKIEQLVRGIRASIRVSGLYDRINDGIVFMGGGALLAGLIEHISKEVNLKAVLGKINIATGKNISNETIFLSSVGLGTSAYNRNYRINSDEIKKQGAIKQVGNYFRVFYQEYF